MALQLNPSKIPIWKSESELQLGLNAEAQSLVEVSNAQERLINLLFQGIAEDQVDLMGSTVGLSETETQDLIERLRPSLLEKSETSTKTSSLDVRFAEIIRIGFNTNQLPESILGVRAKTLIQIQTLDRTGLLLFRALIEAGFRNFETQDFGTVGRDDCGELGYSDSSLGVSRLTAARQLLHGKVNDVVICHPTKRKLKPLVLLSAMHEVAPMIYRPLKESHLAIEFGIETLRITPMISPGRTPCLSCRALWESEQNADWASTAIQLASRNDHLDDAAALLLATGIACRTICQHLEDSVFTGGFEVDLKTRAVRNYQWQFHPSCGCKSLRR